MSILHQYCLSEVAYTKPYIDKSDTSNNLMMHILAGMVDTFSQVCIHSLNFHRTPTYLYTLTVRRYTRPMNWGVPPLEQMFSNILNLTGTAHGEMVIVTSQLYPLVACSPDAQPTFTSWIRIGQVIEARNLIVFYIPHHLTPIPVHPPPLFPHKEIIPRD